MKKMIALVLALSLLLCGCAGSKPDTAAPSTAAPTTEATSTPTTEPTTTPTTEPPTEPAPVYVNPLNGEILDEPYTGRIFASTVSNTEDALPHVGVPYADILMEMYVSSGVVRCLALFTDITKVDAIGSTRSTRLMFNDIAQHYDAILTHAGGSDQVLADAKARGIANYNIDSLYRQTDPLAATTAYRDKEHGRYSPHDLFGYGPGIKAYVESQGVSTTQPADKDYYLTFTDDGTPENGETADKIAIVFGKQTKQTNMIYNADFGRYVFNQYGKEMHDLISNEYEAFVNVIIMRANLSSSGIYQVADFVAGGEGYYACGGKIIPIKWSCDSEDSPFRFTTVDGEQLNLGRGNSYIAIVGTDSPVTWEALETDADAE